MKTRITQLNKPLLGLTSLRVLLENMIATETRPKGLLFEICSEGLWAATVGGGGEHSVFGERMKRRQEGAQAASPGLELPETSLLCSRLARPHCVSTGQGN